MRHVTQLTFHIPLHPYSAGGDEAYSFLDGLVLELASRPGSLSLLERKLVTLENNQSLMSAEGERAGGSRPWLGAGGLRRGREATWCRWLAWLRLS